VADVWKGKFMKYVALLTSIIGLAAIPAMAVPTLTLDPASGIIGGQPGQTVGWGFTLQNTADYVVVSESDYDAVTSLGTYSDFISVYSFIVVGPPTLSSPSDSTSVSQVFDPVADTGVGSFQISPSALAGQSAAGYINVHYDLFSVSPNDPSFDPDVDLIASDQVISALAQVIVQAVPEPMGILPLGVGLMLLGNWWHRRRVLTGGG
jgi:hypothetical protein